MIITLVIRIVSRSESSLFLSFSGTLFCVRCRRVARVVLKIQVDFCFVFILMRNLNVSATGLRIPKRSNAPVEY